MGTPSIAELADRLAPDHAQYPPITGDVADQLLARVVRAYQATEELYEIVARLAGVDAIE